MSTARELRSKNRATNGKASATPTGGPKPPETEFGSILESARLKTSAAVTLTPDDLHSTRTPPTPYIMTPSIETPLLSPAVSYSSAVASGTSVTTTSPSKTQLTTPNNKITSSVATLHAVGVCNLPPHARTPKGFAPYLSRINNLIIYDTMPTRAGKMIVKSRDPQLQSKLKELKNYLGLDIAFETLRPSNCNTIHSPRLPTFSCVVKDVGLEVEIEEVQEHLVNAGINFKNIWRIRSSRLNGADTRLVRVVSTDKNSIDRLLNDGFVLFNRRLRVEPSNAPPPQPWQCGKCQQFHQPGICPNRITCLYCSKAHPFSQCPATEKPAKCANCDQEGHVATSMKCSKRPKPVDDAAIAPLKSADPPSCDKSDTPASTFDMLRFVSIGLINAMPQQKYTIQQSLISLAASVFKVRLTFSYSGGLVHVGCHRIVGQVNSTPESQSADG